MINLLGFAAAGLFSSRVTTTESRVLIAPSHCGLWDDSAGTPTGDNLTDYELFLQRSITIYKTASELGATCDTQPSPMGKCNVYSPKNINYNKAELDNCPFEPVTCQNKTSVRFDTDVLDSSLAFGINSADYDRIGYRTVMECAPVTREGNMGNWTKVPKGFRNRASALQWAPELNLVEAFLPFYYGSVPRDAH